MQVTSGERRSRTVLYNRWIRWPLRDGSWSDAHYWRWSDERPRCNAEVREGAQSSGVMGLAIQAPPDSKLCPECGRLLRRALQGS